MNVMHLLGTAAMLLVMVWRPHISILSISAILRYNFIYTKSDDLFIQISWLGVI